MPRDLQVRIDKMESFIDRINSSIVDINALIAGETVGSVHHQRYTVRLERTINRRNRAQGRLDDLKAQLPPP